MKKLIFKKIIKDISLFFFISITCVATIVWIIQAVNYLDLVSEDGHSLRVYFFYTIFSLPKILSNILPFMFMISLFYVIIQYEINNELIIYWINGISKLNFVNVIIKISIVYFFIQIILTTLIVPYSLDKGRSYFRTSNIDLFSSIIKEKKFIDTVENLTIFVENKINNQLENIIIKEKINENQSQIIIAQKGEFSSDTNITKKIILQNGKIINTEGDDQNIIDFSKFSLDLGRFNTNTITNQKTQEMNTINLIRCIKKIEEFKKIDQITKKKNLFKGCNLQITNSILEEFLKRFLAPIFIILIGLTSSLIITSSKDENSYKTKNFIKFVFGIVLMVISEMILSISMNNINDTILYFFIPIIFFVIIYFYFFLNHRSIG
jgi:lipopolysaccharide export system permease protein